MPVTHYQYENEESAIGMTGFGGLPIYLDLAFVARLPESIEKHLKICSKDQGWTDRQIVLSLIMMNLAGGESVDDLDTLDTDEGFAKLIQRVEHQGMKRKARRALAKRFRRTRKRAVPSASVIFRYLSHFHDETEESKRIANTAFIPKPNIWLRQLYQINWDLVAFAQKQTTQEIATLDGDATLVETNKREALYCYQKYKAYQPFNMYWHEQGLLVHSEFRDGNVNAGYEQTRLLKESLDHLPQGIKKVYHRSDTAGYQQELLQYCANGTHPKFGQIEYAIGVKVTKAFKKAVLEVEEKAWHCFEKAGIRTNQELAEVCFVPNWLGKKKPKKGDPLYRYIAIREPLIEQETLEAIEPLQQEFPFPTMQFNNKKNYKVFGIVTNRTIPGNELIQWHRDRCGKSEEVHAVEKVDLAGGRLPSKLFGANAAWWGIMILAYNLNTIMQRQVLPESWKYKRFKALRYGLIGIAARIISHARQLIIKISSRHPIFEVLLMARQRILEMAQPPPICQSI